MADQAEPTLTAFTDHKRVAQGPVSKVAEALWKRADAGDGSLVLLFDDRDGRQLDLDLRGELSDVLARYGGGELPASHSAAGEGAPRRRGRPKLGVVGREVTLLPRHWEWLQRQRGGPSGALRRLVDEARAAHSEEDERRAAQDAINRVLSAIAGNLPGFEEATRALYRNDAAGFEEQTKGWPADVRRYIAPWVAIALAPAAEE